MQRDDETRRYHEEVQRLRSIQGGGNGGTSDPPRYRMPLARVVELLLTRQHRSSSETVTITRNAKGDYQFEVEAVGLEDETLAETAARAQAVAKTLADEYPLSRSQHHARQTLPNEEKGKR